MAWADRATFDPFVDGWEKSTLHREFEIPYKLRPDFLQIGLWYGTPTIWIHEFKIFGNLYSLDQVARYARIVGEHAQELSIDLWRDGIQNRMPAIRCSVIATGFDRFVYEIADAMDIWLWRLDLAKDTYRLEQDTHPASVAAGTSAIEEKFLPKLMAAGLSEILEEMKIKDGPNG